MEHIDPRGPFVASCPTRVLLDQIADKWSVLVLIAVSGGPVRFNALKRQVEGISQKVLTQTLRKLEGNGLVHRQAFATVPVTVEYEITALGRSLAQIVEQLRQWSIHHIDEVIAARQTLAASSAISRPGLNLPESHEPTPRLGTSVAAKQGSASAVS